MIPATDPLSEVLRRWSLPCRRAGLATLLGPWGVAVPSGFAALYVVLGGECLLTIASEAVADRLQAGDVLLLPRGDAHRLQDQLDSPLQLFPDGPDAGRRETPVDLAPPSARLLFAWFSLDAYGDHSATHGLPERVRLSVDDSPALQGFETLGQLIAAEQAAAAPGWQAVVERLAQTLLVQSVREYLVHDSSANVPRLDAGSRPCLAAVLDETIGPAVGLIHRRPEEAWTVTALAERVNMSKSAFSERFREVVGQPPLHYLTAQRMRKACRLLRETQLGVKEISGQVGYESASSFSNAFKRYLGKSPAGYRKNGGGSP